MHLLRIKSTKSFTNNCTREHCMVIPRHFCSKIMLINDMVSILYVQLVDMITCRRWLKFLLRVSGLSLYRKSVGREDRWACPFAQVSDTYTHKKWWWSLSLVESDISPCNSVTTAVLPAACLGWFQLLLYCISFLQSINGKMRCIKF